MKDYGKSGITDQLISMGDELIKKAGIEKVSKIGIIFAGPVPSPITAEIFVPPTS